MGLVADHIWFPNTSRPCFGGYTLVFFAVLDTVEQSTDKQYKGLPSRVAPITCKMSEKRGIDKVQLLLIKSHHMHQ